MFRTLLILVCWTLAAGSFFSMMPLAGAAWSLAATALAMTAPGMDRDADDE